MSKEISETKLNSFNRAKELFSSYDKYIIMNIDKVTCNQFMNVKTSLPNDTKFYFGKNKIVKKALNEINDDGKFDETISYIKNNVIICFYEFVNSANIIYDICKKYARDSFAKSSDIANNDIVIPAGITDINAANINVFVSNRINTTVVKGKINIAIDHVLVKEGALVGIAKSKLLSLLNILPFKYGCDILRVFEDRQSFDKSLLVFTKEDGIEAIKEVVSEVAFASIGAKVSNKATVPYEIASVFNEVNALALAVGLNIK
ncbi:RLA0 [Hepatospora eriocheir]|uniref:RLA0 n=1 Tax=Hepatospora eriocheir TaxID=1081669 RepID=A0A1X0QA97_9MICR|nr:RLA0 [Hepatospora eriocheir]